MVNFVVNLANLAMKFKSNFEANFDLKAGNFGCKNANFVANFAVNFGSKTGNSRLKNAR